MKPLHIGYDALKRPIRLSPDDRKTHMHIIGSSGSGKSKFMEWMMRGDLSNRQGFCLIDPHGTLYDAVADYCAHKIPRGDVVLLNLSKPDRIIGFNPFRKNPDGDVSVQVDNRITATLHAWNVENADTTPTLERMLRLIYTVMLEHDLALPQIQHLIDFNAHEVRAQLIERLSTPLVQREWRELQTLKPKEWRDETLSAKNRLYRFLTSTALTRFMGLPEQTIDLKSIIEEGKVLLVNLAASKDLSKSNARVFGALLINEFFETALERKKDSNGRDPKPYYLYTDEFQNFVSIDLADMLDEVRKFGLFLVMAHQRILQIDENMLEAVLTNAKIKAVFGGLSANAARLMAENLFIGKLDAKKIKTAIYQTKFFPKYSRDKVYGTSSSQGTSEGSSTGHSTSTSVSSSTSTISTTSNSQSFAPQTDGYFTPEMWFSGSSPTGTTEGRSEGISTSESHSRGETDSYSQSQSTSFSEGESVADIPIFVPVPFQELSSLQYYTHEEQLTEMTAALMEQFGRHCFIKIHQQETQPMLVPFVETHYTTESNKRWYIDQQMTKHHALEGEKVDELLEMQERALLEGVMDMREPEVIPTDTPAKAARKKQVTKPTYANIPNDDPFKGG
jgi:hypothetical protein